jgi:hypothetical protein
MNGVIVANWPIALLIVLAIVGIPLWMTLRHRHAAPDYREARAHDRATRAAPGETETATSDYVPTEPVAAVDGLTIVRKSRAADDDDLAVPAQRHW